MKTHAGLGDLRRGVLVAFVVSMLVSVGAACSNSSEDPSEPKDLVQDQAGTDLAEDGQDQLNTDSTGDVLDQLETGIGEEIQDPGEVSVDVPTQGIVPLEVTFEYSGTRVFDKVDVYLYSQEEGQPACAGIKPWDPPVPADKSGSVPNVSQSIPFMMPDLGPENPVQYYTVLALANDPDQPFGLVMGCDDVEGVVEYGKKKVVTLILHDVAPVYSGTYTVVTHIDLLQTLPDDVENYVQIIVDFLGNPTWGLTSLACALDSPALQELCAAMFTDPVNPDPESLTETGSAVALVLDTFAKAILVGGMGSDIMFSMANFADVLDLRLFSEVTLTLEPDADGLVPSTDASHELQTVSVQWTLGQECDPSDPDCGLQSLTLSAIGMTNLTGPFEFRVPGYTDGVFHEVELGEHTVGFRLGTFLDALVQKVVLPGMMGNGTSGPLVDSFDKYVRALLGGGDCLAADNCCQVFVQEVLQHTSADVQTVLAAGCEALVAMAPPYFNNWLIQLNSDTSPGTILATPPATTCEVYDLNGDYIIDYLGSETDEAKRCQWTLKLEVMGNQVETEVSFWGKRAE